MPTAERGFSLLEVIVCVALFALASAATAGVVAAIARNASPGVTRDAAAMVAENVMARARAATAYASSSTADGTTLIADRTWGLIGTTQRFDAGAQIVAPAVCGGPSPATLSLTVTTNFDPGTQRFTVSVLYPRDPCAALADANAATLELETTLPPPVYPPGQTLTRDVFTPARM
jgi:prepilin-type N-terminal cleavage/methylation domain-containing protein